MRFPVSGLSGSAVSGLSSNAVSGLSEWQCGFGIYFFLRAGVALPMPFLSDHGNKQLPK
jgi:hypothetical protein